MNNKMNKIYDFKARTMDGKEIGLANFKGKVMLIVNTASYCGFTNQFEGLQNLYEKYNAAGFVVLGFPCNQFGNQDPGSDDEIKNFCEMNYGVTFPMFSKIDVNGDNTHPLFAFLKKRAPGLLGKKIKWNFTKFLVDKNGKVLKRFNPSTTPQKIEKHIIKLLSKGK